MEPQQVLVYWYVTHAAQEQPQFKVHVSTWPQNAPGSNLIELHETVIKGLLPNKVLKTLTSLSDTHDLTLCESGSLTSALNEHASLRVWVIIWTWSWVVLWLIQTFPLQHVSILKLHYISNMSHLIKKQCSYVPLHYVNTHVLHAWEQLCSLSLQWPSFLHVPICFLYRKVGEAAQRSHL